MNKTQKPKHLIVRHIYPNLKAAFDLSLTKCFSQVYCTQIWATCSKWTKHFEVESSTLYCFSRQLITVRVPLSAAAELPIWRLTSTPDEEPGVLIAAEELYSSLEHLMPTGTYAFGLFVCLKTVNTLSPSCFSLHARGSLDPDLPGHVWFPCGLPELPLCPPTTCLPHLHPHHPLNWNPFRPSSPPCSFLPT